MEQQILSSIEWRFVCSFPDLFDAYHAILLVALSLLCLLHSNEHRKERCSLLPLLNRLCAQREFFPSPRENTATSPLASKIVCWGGYNLFEPCPRLRVNLVPSCCTPGVVTIIVAPRGLPIIVQRRFWCRSLVVPGVTMIIVVPGGILRTGRPIEILMIVHPRGVLNTFSPRGVLILTSSVRALSMNAILALRFLRFFRRFTLSPSWFISAQGQSRKTVCGAI